MLMIRGSSALTPEKNFKEAPRRSGEDNLAWIGRQLDELADPATKATYVVLVGGTSIYDFRLQVAQSQLRHDMTPSHWSHAAIISTVSKSIAQSRILETSLEPDQGFGVPSMYNGIQGAALKRYQDPATTPNIALIRVPVDPKLWRSNVEGQKSVLRQFAEQRVAVDVPTLILEWLSFVWGAGVEGNPLLRGHGIPSAAVIESLIGAAGYDMCPGVDSTASSPEAFWQTAKWWQSTNAELGIEPLQTRYTVLGSSAPTTKKTGRKAATATPHPTGIPTPRVPQPPRMRMDLTAQLFRE